MKKLKFEIEQNGLERLARLIDPEFKREVDASRAINLALSWYTYFVELLRDDANMRIFIGTSQDNITKEIKLIE